MALTKSEIYRRQRIIKQKYPNIEILPGKWGPWLATVYRKITGATSYVPAKMPTTGLVGKLILEANENYERATNPKNESGLFKGFQLSAMLHKTGRRTTTGTPITNTDTIPVDNTTEPKTSVTNTATTGKHVTSRETTPKGNNLNSSRGSHHRGNVKLNRRSSINPLKLKPSLEINNDNLNLDGTQHSYKNIQTDVKGILDNDYNLVKNDKWLPNLLWSRDVYAKSLYPDGNDPLAKFYDSDIYRNAYNKEPI